MHCMLLSVLVAEDVDVSSTTSAFRSFTVSVPVDEAVTVAKPLSEQFSIPVMSTVALLWLLICAVEVVTVPILVSEALEQVSRQRGPTESVPKTPKPSWCGCRSFCHTAPW